MRKIIIRFAEPLLFLVVVIANMSLLFETTFFPTLDGVAHLYNANILTELLFDSNSYLHGYYVINEALIPNWTGHFILTLAGLGVPPMVADKIFLTLYMVGLPFSFRLLLKTAGATNMLFSYAIFPFTYSFALLYGFYNFAISLPFLFLTMACWLSIKDKPWALKRWLALSILFLIVYFSHIFTLFILLVITGLYLIFEFATGSFRGKEKIASRAGRLWEQGLYLVSASAIPIVLAVIYSFKNSVLGNPKHLPGSKLIDDLERLGTLIAYLPEIEEIFTTRIFWILAGIFCLVVILRILSAFRKALPPLAVQKYLSRFRSFELGDFWLLAAVVILILYFILPDSNGSAGYVSNRLSLLFFMAMIIWLGIQKLPWWISGLAMAGILFCHFQLNRFYREKIAQLNGVAKHCVAAAAHVEPNSTVLPLNYTWDWMDGHFSNYLALEKPMVVLDNYEAIVGYFPIQWNEEDFPQLLLGNKTSGDFSCVRWKSKAANPAEQIDYVFMLGSPPQNADECQLQLHRTIGEHYEVIYENRDCTLYRLKKSHRR